MDNHEIAPAHRRRRRIGFLAVIVMLLAEVYLVDHFRATLLQAVVLLVIAMHLNVWVAVGCPIPRRKVAAES
jgi:hypothetical protein